MESNRKREQLRVRKAGLPPPFPNLLINFSNRSPLFGRRADSSPHFLCRNFGLHKQQKIIVPPRLRVCPGHVEAAKRMRPHERSSALPIQIKVADMKLSPRSLQLFFVRTINSSSQPELRVVGNLQCVVIVLSLNHCQHWSE